MNQPPEPSVTGYAPPGRVPLSGYALTLAFFTTGFALAAARTARLGGYRPKPADIVFLGAGTHKLTRILAKAFVTAPLRAPFTRRADQEGAGEVHDIPRGTGLRHTVGNLLTCPYCLGPWVATAFASALVVWPRETRFALGVLSAVAISDFLHQRYATLNEARKLTQWERKQAELEHRRSARDFH